MVSYFFLLFIYKKMNVNKKVVEEIKRSTKLKSWNRFGIG